MDKLKETQQMISQTSANMQQHMTAMNVQYILVPLRNTGRGDVHDACCCVYCTCADLHSLHLLIYYLVLCSYLQKFHYQLIGDNRLIGKNKVHSYNNDNAE